MKASDFTTSGGERDQAMSRLIQTEQTDAVNTGLVGSADKSARSLKANLFDTGRAGHKAGTSSVTHAVKKTAPADASTTDAAHSAIQKSRAKGSAFSGDGPAPMTGEEGIASQSRHHLTKRLKGQAKGAALSKASHAALSDSELEGADDLAYGGRNAYRVGKAVKRRLRAAKGKGTLSSSAIDPLEGEKSLGALSEKAYKKKAAAAKKMSQKMQFSRYFQKNVYTQAAAASGLKKGAALLSGGIKGLLAPLASAASQLLPVVLSGVLIFGLVAAVSGGAADEDKKSASLDGMPAWVTYDLVLSCLKAHETYGYPASALLGQMMLENGTSDSGSALGRDCHNYAGIKYFGNIDGLITGYKEYLTGEYTGGGSYYTTRAKFAVFASDEAFMEYRCTRLYKQSNYTSVPDYQKAIDTNNSELFLRALGEGGYYTTSQDSYVATYRSICEQFPLVKQLDSMTSAEFESLYSGSSANFEGGEDYKNAEQWQKDIVNACHSVPTPGGGLCATWVSQVYNKAGLGWPSGNGNSMLSGYATSTDWSHIKVGQIVSAQGSPTSLGKIYGHVAIYIGDGQIMDNVGSIRTMSLSEWVSYYGQYGWVVYGWPW